MSSGNKGGRTRVRPSVNRPTIAALVLVMALAVACQRVLDDESGATVSGVALAGPTCPVVREPPDPACEDRPVAGAEILVVDERGRMVGRVQTDDAGAFTVVLPAGKYQLVPQPVEGLLGPPEATAFVVQGDVDPEPLTILFDTGIR
jgi:hypothetical protein